MNADKSKFFGLLFILLIGSFIGRVIFYLIVGSIAYFAFGASFETASFIAIISFIVTTFLTDGYDILSSKKKKRKKGIN